MWRQLKMLWLREFWPVPGEFDMVTERPRKCQHARKRAQGGGRTQFILPARCFEGETKEPTWQQDAIVSEGDIEWRSQRTMQRMTESAGKTKPKWWHKCLSPGSARLPPHTPLYLAVCGSRALAWKGRGINRDSTDTPMGLVPPKQLDPTIWDIPPLDLLDSLEDYSRALGLVNGSKSTSGFYNVHTSAGASCYPEVDGRSSFSNRQDCF